MSEATTETVNERATSPLRQMQIEDDRSFREWLDVLAPDGAVKVQIVRKKPLQGPNNENIAGILETVEERIDEDYLRETWGGGTYQLKVLRPNAAGSYVYTKSRHIQLAGPPKDRGRELLGGGGGAVIAAGSGESDTLAERALTTLERTVERERERADRAQQFATTRQGSGIDQALLETMIGPIRQQNELLAAQNQDLQKQLAELARRPPPTDPFRDRLVEKMVDGESSRLDHLRASYENRIAKLQDDFADERKRWAERAESQIERLERQHERAVQQQDKAHEQQMRAQETAHQTRVDSLKSEIAKLERELQQSTTRIGALEARKDQSLTEKAEELVKVREALEGIGGGGEDDKQWYEKLIESVGSSEVAMQLINKIGSATGANQAVAAPTGLPPGQLAQGPDGQIYVIGPDGQPQPVPPQMRQRLLAAAARRRRRPVIAPPAPVTAAGAPPAPGGAIDEALADPAAPPAAAPGRAPDAKEVQLALTFMAGAFQNGTAPETFATTARSMVPTDILRFIGTVGVDQFLATVLEPASNSPLATQRGRTWVRAVFKAINGG